MESHLQQLIELQTEQNELLRRYLWRIRFSLGALLLLTTALCCGMGFVAYKQTATPMLTALAPGAPISPTGAWPTYSPWANSGVYAQSASGPTYLIPNQNPPL